MDFNSLKTILQFFQITDSIVKHESHNLFIEPTNEKRGGWNYSYKGFQINRVNSQELLATGYFVLQYEASEQIAIAIPSCDAFNIEYMVQEGKVKSFKYTQCPYINNTWWKYLWFPVSEDRLTELQNESIENQEKILLNYLKEVMEFVRNHETTNNP